MKKTALALTLILMLSVSIFYGLSIHSVEADVTATIYIRADGSVDPVGAPIQRDGDIYTLTGDADGIWVYRSNMTLDGNGHTLLQTLGLQTVTNVTIKNFIIIIDNAMCNIFLDSCSNVTIFNNTVSSFPELEPLSLGIGVWGGTSNVIAGNRIVDNVYGIAFEFGTSNNRVFGNNITGNFRSLRIYASQNNSIYHNNFDNNTVNVFIGGAPVGTSIINTFDNGTTGNYWSDYEDRYPNAAELNDAGIWNTPYVIDEHNQDRYPLKNPVTIPEFPEDESTTPTEEPFPTTLVMASIGSVAIVGLGLLVYFKKRGRGSNP
jgi:parallel beta-helix repeat protein